MACLEPCCNGEARNRLHAERVAEFEAWLAQREHGPVVVTEAPAETDISYMDAIYKLDFAEAVQVLGPIYAEAQWRQS